MKLKRHISFPVVIFLIIMPFMLSYSSCFSLNSTEAIKSASPKSSGTVDIPRGGIVMWSGSVDSIPEGWLLCNGSNETPDLRDRFIMGGFKESDINKTGGSALPHNHTYSGILEHNHTITDLGHQHVIVGVIYQGPSGTLAAMGSSSYSGTNINTDKVTTGITIDYEGEDNPSTKNASSLPPYYKLAFIMRNGTSGELPPGAIVMWSESLSSIPSGWAFCDGSSGTPDLRDKLIYGVSQDEDPGATVHYKSHNHTYDEVYNHTHEVVDPGHNHGILSEYTQTVLFTGEPSIGNNTVCVYSESIPWL